MNYKLKVLKYKEDVYNEWKQWFNREKFESWKPLENNVSRFFSKVENKSY